MRRQTVAALLSRAHVRTPALAISCSRRVDFAPSIPYLRKNQTGSRRDNFYGTQMLIIVKGDYYDNAIIMYEYIQISIALNQPYIVVFEYLIKSYQVFLCAEITMI